MSTADPEVHDKLHKEIKEVEHIGDEITADPLRHLISHSSLRSTERIFMN